MNGADHTTYVAEQNLSLDDSGEPIEHPLLDTVLGPLEGGRYGSREQIH